MTEKPLISVIVPVYKVEQYLVKCVDSIVNQTYKNLEIILVDDGSPDNCGAICDDYAKRDNRLVVIHKENGGLSSARNAGLDIAKGEYIGFVDSDDWIELDMYEYLYDRLVANEADVAICGINIVATTEKKPITRLDHEQVMTSIQAMECIYCDAKLNVSVWNRLYVARLFDDVTFPLGKCHEDVVTTFLAFSKAEKIVYSPHNKYNYLIRDGSITTAKISKQTYDEIGQWDELLKKMADMPDIQREASARKYCAYTTFFRKLLADHKCIPTQEHYDCYNKVMAGVRTDYHTIINHPKLSLKHKIVLTIARYELFIPFRKFNKGR